MFLGLAPVMAQENACVSISNEHCYAGEMVEMELKISGCNGFTNLGLEIEYDNSFMELVEVNESSYVGATFTAAEKISKNPYNMGWDSTENTYFNGTLATLRFLIFPHTPKGEYWVNVDFYKGRDGNYQDGIAVNYDQNDIPLNLTYQKGFIVVENKHTSSGGSGGGGGAAATDVTASLLKAEGYAGETVDVALELSNNRGFANLGLEAKYDSSVLTLLKVSDNKDTGATFTAAQSTFSNPFNVGWDSISNVTYNGNLATFTFKISEEAPPGKYPVTLSYYKGRDGNYVDGISVNYDENDNPLNLCYKDGFVTVLENVVEEPDESVYRVEFVSDKKEYAIGEPFEVDVWLCTDDYSIRVYEDEYEVSGFDNSRAGVCNVIVSFGGYSENFEIRIIEDKEIEAIPNCVVKSVATEGVWVSPSGYSEVKKGTAMKYVIGAQEGYDIENVLVNGERVTLTDGNLNITVNENTVIEAFGKKKKFSISKIANKNGYIDLSEETVEYGESCTAKIVANDGYIIKDVLVDGKSVGSCKGYTFVNVKENHTIEALFEKIIKTVTVKASAQKGGRVYPARSTVNEGANAKFTVTEDYGYHIDYVLVDGIKKEISSNEIYLENVTQDTELLVVFQKNEFCVTVNDSEGADMSVQYNGQSGKQLNVPYLESADIVIELLEGYKLNTLYVNNTPVKAKKIDGRLIYNSVITKDTVVSLRCSVSLEYEFSQKVREAGLASDINELNAYQKKEIFTSLADEYAHLSVPEQRACTSAYSTVLASLDRANAYIALIESDIIARILRLPQPIHLTMANYRDYKDEIDSIYNGYEKMTPLSKSLIDYKYVSKLSLLRKKAEEAYKESKNIILYLYELIDSVPYDEDLDKESISAAYSKLVLAEDTYYAMRDEDKNDVSKSKYNELIEKHAKIASQIQRLYITPFTGRVLRCSPVVSEDSFAEAETKRVAIYNLMNEYHSFPDFIKTQIFPSTLQKLNSLYESASIKVSTTVNNLPVDMNGDFDEEVDLVLTEPELDSNAVSDATGKTIYQAIDVKMYSKQQEIQPASKIRIKMEISKELSDADVSVVYITDDGLVYDVQGEVIEEEGKCYIIFFIDHFSSFAVLYNESEAEKAQLAFESEYAEIGSIVTAHTSGAINNANCIIYLTGYSSDGVATFAEMGSGSVKATVADNTQTVKAMLWDKNLGPITDDISLPVTE